MRVREDFRSLTGPEKAAMLMLALGEEHTSRLFAMMDDEERIGAALRTRAGVKPMYISPGHRVSLETAIRLTLAVCDGPRIPRPTRDADRYVSEMKAEGRGDKGGR